jgi:hypothetical protein
MLFMPHSVKASVRQDRGERVEELGIERLGVGKQESLYAVLQALEKLSFHAGQSGRGEERCLSAAWGCAVGD